MSNAPSIESTEEQGRLVARNVTANWLWYLLVLASGFVLPRFIDEYQGRELLGIWDFGWSLQASIGLLALGTASSVNRYVARYRTLGDWAGLNAAVNSSLLLLIGSMCVGVAGAIGFASLVPYLVPDTDPNVIVLAREVVLMLCIAGAVQLPGSVFNAIITGYERFDILNLIRGTKDALVFGAMVASLVLGRGLYALAVLVLLATVLEIAAKAVSVRLLCGPLCLSPRYCSKGVLLHMVGFGGKTLAQGVARMGLYQVNGLIVAFFLGPAVLAVYARQRALIMHLMRFMKQYAQVFIPRSSVLHAEGDMDGLRRLMTGTTRFGFYVTLPIVVFLVIMGGPLLNLWMGPDYEAPAVLAILALGHVLAIPQMGAFTILMGLGQHGLAAILEVAAAIVSILMGIVLLGVFESGIVGAAVAVGLPVAMVGGVLTPCLACRVLSMKFRSYFHDVLPGPFVATIPLALWFILARKLYPDHVIHQLAWGIIGGGLITILVYWTWVLPHEIKHQLTRAPLALWRTLLPASR